MRRLLRLSVGRRLFVSADVSLRDRFERGLAAPICLTWELTYACNLACTHCLSSSGRRDPLELSTAEAKALIDEIATMKIFYINIGGGEPMIRRDFFESALSSPRMALGLTQPPPRGSPRLTISISKSPSTALTPRRVTAFVAWEATTLHDGQWTTCVRPTSVSSRFRL
jgi:hypothetical protein